MLIRMMRSAEMDGAIYMKGIQYSLTDAEANFLMHGGYAFNDDPMPTDRLSPREDDIVRFMARQTGLDYVELTEEQVSVLLTTFEADDHWQAAYRAEVL